MSKNKTAQTRTAAQREQRTEVIASIATVLLFFGILVGFGLVTVFSEKESFSEAALRTTFPTILRVTTDG